MREVSCRALDPFFRAFDRSGIARSELARDVGYSLAHLQNRHEYVEWDAFCRVMTNVRRHFSEQQLTEIGAIGLKSPGFRSFALIGRTLFSAGGFYRWMLSSGGMGNQLFSNMVPLVRELGPGHFVLDLQLAPGYEPCPDFFLFATGGFQALPELVGLHRAEVKMTPLERGARFEITFEDKKARRAQLLRILTKPFDAKSTAAELNETIRELEQRYAQLEVARAALERKQVVLDAAHSLGHRVWAERDPQRVADELTRSLIGIIGIVGARVSIDGVLSAAAGAIGAREARVSADLTGRQMTGCLEAWTQESRDETHALLSLLAPNVALAVDNALAYREIQEYQRGLERLVQERTIELRQAVAQLREAQESRSKFFANISHEIRTPLSLILLAVADVEARSAAALDGRAREDLQAIVDSARKLLRLVDELLLLAASRETELEIAPKAADLGRLVAALAATWRPAAEAAGVALHVAAPERLVSIFDPVAIERVITNLLSNAVKFTPNGGRVSLEVEREGEEIAIVVRDTGIGIPDDLMERLFGRFERGSNTALRGGSGIGLSLVRELVEAHEGKVEVERLEGGGTQFRVTLPVREPAHVVAETPAPRLRPSDFGVTAAPIRSGEVIAPRKSGATILVAEDDPRLADAIARLLGEEHTVVVALDGLAALALVKKYQPHLLVTDVEMPGMDGIELTRRFREITGEKLAPVVILSAVADLGTRVAGLEAGAVDYVVKPFDPAELQARVRSQLSMRDLAVRLHRAEQLSALGTLSSGLAHELRNPANAIVNAVGPLKMLLPPELAKGDSPVAQLVDVLGSCAEQIGFLSRQLLSFKRGGDLELRNVALQDVLARAIAQAQPSLRMIELRERIEVHAPIRCAPPLMVQVLSNLIDNASHAAGAGGWVEITAEDRGDRIVIEVADSGEGVPVELRDRIFEPFFTTKPPGVGTGLGLPLARDIIHRHGGLLEVRERGDRSVFVVELPRLPDPAATRAAARVMMQARGEGR